MVQPLDGCKLGDWVGKPIAGVGCGRRFGLGSCAGARLGIALGDLADARLFCRKCYYGRRFARGLSSVGYRNSQAISIPAALMQQQPGLNQVGATGFASQGGAQQGFELSFFAT
jgi:hypothetical protein